MLGAHGGWLRSWVFTVYFVLQLAQGGSWCLFASLPDETKAWFPSITDADLSWQINANNIGQALATPLAAWLLQDAARGLRRTVLYAAALLVAQGALWCGASALPGAVRAAASGQQQQQGGSPGVVRVLLLAGAVAGGASTAFTQGAPSRFSAVWFPPRQRARATGALVSATYLGQSAAYALCFGLISSGHGLVVALAGFLVAAVLLGLLVAARFPSRPAVGGGGAAGGGRGRGDVGAAGGAGGTGGAGAGNASSFVARVRSVASDRSCAALLVVSSVACGFYTNWQAALPVLMERQGRPAHEGDVLGFASGVTYGCGGLLAGALADRFFARRLAKLLQLALSACALSFLWVVVVLPPAWMEDHGFVAGAGNSSRAMVLCAVATTGLFAGIVVPVALELLAEISYPTRY